MKYLLKKSLFILAALTVFLQSGCIQKPADITDNGTKSSACEIKKFAFLEADNIKLKDIGDINGVIDGAAKTIKFSMPEGVDLTALKPTIVVSDKAKVTPASGAVKDFSNPVKYTVTAEDGTKNQYTVTESTEARLIKFAFMEADNDALKDRGNYFGDIDEAAKTVKVKIPKGIDLTALKPAIVVSNKAKVTPASGAVKDFSNPVKYTVTPKEGEPKEYTVTVTDDIIRLVSYMEIRGGSVQGALTKASQEQIDAIFNGDNNVVIDVLGPSGGVLICSKYYFWSSVERDGKECELHPGYVSSAYGLKSSTYIPFEIPNVGMELEIALDITDTDGNSETFKFKVKRNTGTVDVPVSLLILDGYPEFKNPNKKELSLVLCDGTNPEFVTDVDSTKITVSYLGTENVMKSVNIGGQAVGEIKKTTTNSGATRWIAETRIDTHNSADVVVVIEPEDTVTYHTLTWKFRMHKIDLSDNNEFIYTEFKGQIRPQIMLSGTFDKQGEKLYSWRDFGAYKADYTVYTKARTSKVWYQFVGFDGEGLPGCDAKQMTPHDNRTHTAEVILFEDKPTPIRIWVESGKGETDKGNPKSDFIGAIFNKVNVFYGYKEKTLITETTFDALTDGLKDYTRCLSEIEIDKNQVEDNKIYIVFEMVREQGGFAPGEVPASYDKQTPIRKLGDSLEPGKTQWYGTMVDVSSLTNQGDSLEVLLPISPADDYTKILFPYKLKVKIK